MNEHDDMNCEPAIPTRCAGHNCGTETAQHSPECILEAAIIQGWSTEDTLAAAKAVFDARATPPAAQVQGECNCPGFGKQSAASHAPNCPARKAQVQGEQPEVVALRWRVIDPPQNNPGWQLDFRTPVLDGVEEQPLMTVAQHHRIVAALESDWRRRVLNMQDTRNEVMRENAELRVDLRAALSAPPATGTTSDKYRAELYDEVWEKARDMGYMNVTMALADLKKLKADPPVAGVPEGWNPMDTAPKDGTLLRLLVDFDDHAIDDGAGPFATVGQNFRDNTGDDTWQFVGWCWEHDHFTDGKGTPVGWLPMLSAPPAAGVPEGLRDLLEMLIEPDDRRLRHASDWRAEVHDRAAALQKALAAPTPPASEQQQAVVMSAAAADVLAERQRQISAEDFDAMHDDMATGGQLGDAAACYALWAGGINPGNWYQFWPWARKWLKHSDPRRMLVKAGALILAEVERIDRRDARLNLHLAGVNQGVTTEAGNGGDA